MQKEVLLNQYNLQIFNFNFIYKTYIEKNYINDLFNYGIHQKVKDSTARKLFIHHNIHSICEFIINEEKKGKQVLFFDFNNLIDGEIIQYIDEDKLKSYFKYVYLKIKRLLPIRIHYSPFSFTYFLELLKKNNGFTKENVLRIRSLVDRDNFDKFTFEKCKRFVKSENLLFLDKIYFNSLKAKHLLIN